MVKLYNDIFEQFSSWSINIGDVEYFSDIIKILN